MQKLLAKFYAAKSMPETARAALRLLAYLDKHPFAICIGGLSLADSVTINRLREQRARAIHAVYCAKAA